ncbi:MAG: hypothetical protein ACOCYB_03870, partial [Alkalispirochaeta sp.]
MKTPNVPILDVIIPTASRRPRFARFSRYAALGVMLLAAVLITGCTRGSQGIFATIEVEEKTKTSNLVDNTSA